MTLRTRAGRYADPVMDELRAALDRDHFHREYGYFGGMGGAGWAHRRVGRPGCRTCELIGRPLHTEHNGLSGQPGDRSRGPYPGRCLAWHEDGD